MASTIVSWGLTISLVGIAIYVYRPDLLTTRAPPGSDSKPPITEPSSKPTNKKSKPKKTAVPKVAEKAESASDGQGNKKRKLVSAPVDKTVTTSTSNGQQQQQSRSEDDGLTDKDFARQLAQAQSGTKLQAPQKHQQPSKKDRRASKLAPTSNTDPSGFSTEASSTTGRDADDDLTPAESPEARPADVPVSRAGDISDMLEAPAAKPTTLRLTGVSNEDKQKKPSNKAFEQVLSKKKRNEQARKEEQRLAREESDRIHEAKKQEQLRKARMAAGTSNQTKANNFVSKANAWQSGASNTVKAAPTDTAEPLLDTFDNAQSTAGPAHGSVHTEHITSTNANELKSEVGGNTAAALVAPPSREGPSYAKRQEYSSDISEEDQVKLLKQQQQEDAWEPVTSKKSRKKGKGDTDSTSGASSPTRAAPIAVKPLLTENKLNGIQKKADTSNRFESFQNKTTSGLQDAEWEA